MANTTWKQVVLDTAEAYREATQTTSKIPVGQLASKIREGAGENLDDELNALESTLQEVLDILPFKGFQNSGQYVWKKLTNVITYTAYCTKANGASGGAFTLDSSDVDLTQLNDLTTLAPIEISRTYGDYTPAIKSEDGINFEYWLNGAYQNSLTASWDKSTKTLTLKGTVMSGTNWTPFYYDTHSQKELVDYVVSNDAEAYPNGAVHTDGYWYELVGEGFDFEKIFNITQTAVNTYTPSSDIASSNAAIPHSLGVIPKVAIIYGYPTRLAGNLEQAVAFYPTSGTGCSILARQEDSGYTMANGSNSDTKATSSTVKFSHGTIWFKAGVEYTLITMA